MTLRDKLNGEAPELWARFRSIETTAVPLLEYSQGGAHLSFTPHGVSHVRKVEAAADMLLGDEGASNLSTTEVFLLLVATLYHDSQMIPRYIGDELRSRASHHDEASTFLVARHLELGLTEHEAWAAGQVIRGHGLDVLDDIENEFALGQEIVDLRRLAACLSMADICHADASRAPKIVLHYLDLDAASDAHWRRHLQIVGISRVGERLLVNALTYSEEGERSVASYKRAIEEQLGRVAPYFRSKPTAISSVELKSRRLASSLQRPLRFQPDMPAIVRIFIDGLYPRADVFIRELVQNSLDACLLQDAVARRRGQRFTPQVLITQYFRSGEVVAVRVDDNGIGMGIDEVEDTVLWLGRTSATKKDVAALLEGVERSLIATFGIGLLSCFRASTSVTIRTAKVGQTPLALKLSGVEEILHPEQSSDKSEGTTVLVELAEPHRHSIDVRRAISHYFRGIEYANLSILELEWSNDEIGRSRESLFRLAIAEADPIEVQSVGIDEDHVIVIDGVNYRAAFEVTKGSLADGLFASGSLEILSAGIFVCDSPTGSWLPPCLGFLNGRINCAAGSIDLSAARDGVRDNSKWAIFKEQLALRLPAIIQSLRAKLQELGASRDNVALLFARMLGQADDGSRRSLLREAEKLKVDRIGSASAVTLESIISESPAKVYVTYRAGRTVNEVATVDGMKMYAHLNAEIAELQSSIVAQQGGVVIRAARHENEKGAVLERDLLEEVFKSKGIELMDLMSTPVEGDRQSLPVSDPVRRVLGERVKFVELAEFPNRKSWRMKSELWINIANPSMKTLYSRIRDGELSDIEVAFANVLVKILEFDLDQAVEYALLGLLVTH